MHTISTATTDPGRKRERNEDTFSIDEDLELFFVSDGMGGHAAGEVASAAAVAAAARALERHEPQIRRVQAGRSAPEELVPLGIAAVEEACRAVWRLAESRPEYHGMGCTLTGVLLAGRKALVLHVGDTRLYLLRGGGAHQLTSDHTLAAELARGGAIPADRVRSHPYAHVLTRALGVQESVKVDTLLLDVLPGDRLVLASDGLTDYVVDASALAALAAGVGLDDVPGALVRFANESGGHDNITVVAVDVDADPDQRTEALALAEDVRGRLEALAGTFLFDGLDLAQLSGALAFVEERDVAAGERILRSGDPCAQLFIVAQGRVGVEREGAPAAELRPGDHVGEALVLRPRPCGASLVALERTRLLVLDHDALRTLASRSPHLGRLLLERLGRRLSRSLLRANERCLEAGGDGLDARALF